jgi:hypothetical protein
MHFCIFCLAIRNARTLKHSANRFRGKTEAFTEKEQSLRNRFRSFAVFYHGLLNITTPTIKNKNKNFLFWMDQKGKTFWRLGISKHNAVMLYLDSPFLIFADCSGLARATSAVSKYLSSLSNIPRHPLSDFWDINVSVLSTWICSSCRV